MTKLIDLTGQRFGRLVVMEPAPTFRSPSGQTQRAWHCLCDCGERPIVRTHSLRTGRTLSCGCQARDSARGRYDTDMPGSRFGKWLVGERCGVDSIGLVLFSCTCDCGAVFKVRGSILRRGLSKGCLTCSAVAAATAAKIKDVVGYDMAHDRVRAARGRASSYACVDCGGAAVDWSYDGGDPDELRQMMRGSDLAYSLDIQRYSPRCRRDHRRYDNARRKATT